MANTTLKRWNSTTSQWEELNPQTTHTQIVASGTPDSTTYLRGDGTWATVEAGTTFDGGTITGNLEISNTLPKINLTDTNNNSDFHIANNNGTLEIADTTNQAARIQIGSNGNVGIGTTSPTGKLNIVDSSTKGLEFQEITGGIMRMLAYDRTNSVEVPLELRGDSIDFETNGTRRFLINDSGAAVTGSLTVGGTAVSLDGHNHNTLYYTKTQTDTNISTAVSNLVDSSPATLDTLNELAAALGDDPNFATTVTNSIATKVSSSLLSVAAGANTVAQRDASGNLTTAGQLNFANNDGFVYNDTTNIMYVKKDGTDRAIITDDTIGSQSVNYATSSGSTTGNAATATKLATARNIALAGDITGSANFDGSGNISITATVANDSHTHDGRYYTESESDGRYIRKNVGYDWTATGANRLSFRSNDTIDTSSGSQASLEVYQDTAGADAFMQFHIGGDYAAYFGLHGGINDFVVGGWSKGAGYQRIFHDGYHPNADKWTTARTITLGGDLTGSVSLDGSANVTLSAQVTNGSHTHDDRYYTESESDSRFGRFTNDITLNSSGDTASFIAELTNEQGCFQNNYRAMKVSWNYAGNSDLNTGHPTIGTIELAGCLIEAWGGTYKHIRITRPTTGTGGSTVCVYNDQGSSYSPGWREIWTSESDGSGSGLDADLLDGIQGSQFLRSDANDTTSGTLGIGAAPGTNISFHTEGNATIRDNINVGDITIGGGGTFYTDSGSRVRINQDFYTNNSNTYLYATNLYLGDSSGDNIRFRGNPLIGNAWSIGTDGTGSFSNLNVNGDPVWTEASLTFSLVGTTLTITA